MFFYLSMLGSEEDRSKFERIYRNYRALMFYIANGILRNDSDAEDAVHQAFLSILENMQHISDPDSPAARSYCAIIAEHKAIDIVRSRNRTPDLVSIDDVEYGVEIELPVGSALADAMARLPATQREILLLKYVHGYSTYEIAKILGMKRDTVGKALYRAKTILKTELEGEGVPL